MCKITVKRRREQDKIVAIGKSPLGSLFHYEVDRGKNLLVWNLHFPNGILKYKLVGYNGHLMGDVSAEV